MIQRKIYFWIEDHAGKSGYTFWKTFMAQLFPDVIVESKQNNSRLVQAVEQLTDEENEYIIVYDHSFDNPAVVKELHKLRKCLHNKNNVHELHLICFEYILLEFAHLLDWIFAPQDDLREKRTMVINVRENILYALKRHQSYKELDAVQQYFSKPEQYNIEQMVSKVLFGITRNTGFEVSKGNLGSCWVEDCCDWTERQEDDICGLDNSKLSCKNKMKRIYSKTSLKRELSTCGLEVNPND